MNLHKITSLYHDKILTLNLIEFTGVKMKFVYIKDNFYTFIDKWISKIRFMCKEGKWEMYK